MRTLILATWGVLALALLVCAVLPRLTHGRCASLGELLRRMTDGRVRFVAVFVGWMWLGWHFFAR